MIHTDAITLEQCFSSANWLSSTPDGAPLGGAKWWNFLSFLLFCWKLLQFYRIKVTVTKMRPLLKSLKSTSAKVSSLMRQQLGSTCCLMCGSVEVVEVEYTHVPVMWWSQVCVSCNTWPSRYVLDCHGLPKVFWNLKRCLNSRGRKNSPIWMMWQ